MKEDSLFNLLQDLEVSLHKVNVRNDRDLLDRLLHEDFHEISRSGESYLKADTLESLTHQNKHPEISAQNFRFRMISNDACLLTYECAQRLKNGELTCYAKRSSIWKYHANGWQMLFHQGTPTPPF